MPKINRDYIRNISILLFIVSCSIPAVNHKIGFAALTAFIPLIVYPLGWHYLFCWSANIFYFLALKRFKKGESSFSSSVIAVSLSILFYILVFLNDFKVSFTEQPITIHIGYYIWVMSFLLLPAYQTICFIKKKTNHEIKEKYILIHSHLSLY